MGEPQFDRMVHDILRAKAAFDEGNYELCRRLLRVVSSIAYADSVERGPNDPVPEAATGSEHQQFQVRAVHLPSERDMGERHLVLELMPITLKPHLETQRKKAR